MQKVYGKDVSKDRIEKAIGIADLHTLIIQLKDWGKDLYVIESDTIIADPSTTMKNLCDHLGLQWDDTKLHWDKGSLPDWKIWEESGWHDNAKETTSFEKKETSKHYDDEPYTDFRRKVHTLLQKSVKV